MTNQCKHGQLARSCEICELEQERDSLRATADALGAENERLQVEVAQLRSSRDPENGNGPTWCGVCGGIMQCVRPGQHRCDRCGELEHLRAVKDAVREWLCANTDPGEINNMLCEIRRGRGPTK
jgi:hypothetical protein